MEVVNNASTLCRKQQEKNKQKTYNMLPDYAWTFKEEERE